MKYIKCILNNKPISFFNTIIDPEIEFDPIVLFYMTNSFRFYIY